MARRYPWGVLEVDKPENSDFVLLRDTLLRTHTQHLIDTTHEVHYEAFRARKLGEAGAQGGTTSFATAAVVPKNGSGGGGEKELPFLEQLEQEKEVHAVKMAQMEREMSAVFDIKVKEKMAQLRRKEERFLKQHDDMRRDIELAQSKLKAAQLEFEKEKAAYIEERDRRAAMAKDSKGKSRMFGGKK
eukprot:UC1_evm1s978